MKLNDILKEWDEPDYDSLSYHQAAGASEARTEERVDDMMEYLDDPEMQDHIKKYYPALGNLSVQNQAERILFAKVGGVSVIDQLDYDDMEQAVVFMDFENVVEDAMKVVNKQLSTPVTDPLGGVSDRSKLSYDVSRRNMKRNYR